MKKISVIGAGYVGATIAYALDLKGIANDIVLIDINKDKARAEADDVPSPKKQTKNTREKPNEKNDKYDIKLLYSTAFIPRFA